jgi:hypothetical protein
MAINPKCVQQINQAAGRRLTENQLAEIESRLRRTATMLARDDLQAWRSLSADQRTLKAAEQAMADIKAEAQVKVRNAALQVLKTAQTEERLRTNQRVMGGANRHEALVRDLEQTEVQVEAIKREMTAGMLDTIEASTSKQGVGVGRRAAMFLWDVSNPAMTRDLAFEIFRGADGSTGNALAQKGAKAWLDTIEAARVRFNGAGGDVGKLDYGYLPQPHDAIKIARAQKDGWANQVLPLLDRSRYLNEDGSRMNDQQVLDFLRRSYETITSDGANKRDPGAFTGSGARANRGGDAREIHFKDGDAYLQYLSDFGGGSMYDAMMGHIAQKARDIALVERYGPNPNNQMRLQMDLAKRADGNEERRVFGQRLETYWNIVSGNASSVAGRGLVAQIGQDVRNIQTAGKLAGALLSSVTDLGTYFITTGFNKLSYFDALANIVRANTKEARELMSTHGLMAETLLSSLNRWTGENVRDGITGRLANSTMRLSLLNAWTDGLRRSFQMTMMSGLARLHGIEWAKLTEYDRWRLESKGLTEDDWKAINTAKLDDYNGTPLLTPDAVRSINGQAATKLLSLIVDESQTAIINPDLATRAWATAGEQRGTIRGELWRSVMQFKSFPIAMISRHWRRAFEVPDLDGAPMVGNRLAYASALGLSLTMLGAVAFQAKQVVTGKDPVDMTQPKFWVRAMAQGGAAGFFGDVLLENSADSLSRSDPMFRLAGPTAGSVADLFELTKGNIDEAISGKQTHAGAEALRFARSHLPYVNLWYAKTALERTFINDLQETLSPGYLARMKQKMQKDWKQQFWWDPTDTTPSRAPDLGAAVGQ